MEWFIQNDALPRMEAGEAMIWVIVLKDAPDEAVGVIDARFKESEGGNRGFWLGEPFWNHGYMTEGVTAVQDYYFFELGMDKLIVTNAKSNIGSRRIKEKTGAKFLGYHELPHHSGDNESEKWEITREGWAAFRKA